MARSKVNHSKSISSEKPIRGIGAVSPGDLLSFTYKGEDVYDRKPIIMILSKEGKVIHGVNINYLKEFVVGRLLEETNFKKLKWYSLYTKAFRTYSKSKMSSLYKVSYKNPKLSDDAQDIIDSVS
jgi:hypothetical protein